MRDMLASLSEIDDLEKIKMLHSIIVDAMDCIRKCAEFIEAYVQHGFWGESALRSSIETSDRFEIGRFGRELLSSNVTGKIERF